MSKFRILALATALLALTASAASATTKVRVEYVRLLRGGDAGTPVTQVITTSAGAAQTVTAAATSVQSSAAPTFPDDRNAAASVYARITPLQGAAIVLVGDSPSASETSGTRIALGQDPIFLPIKAGQKVAVIEASDRATAASGSDVTAISATPVVSTSPAYTSGDVVGSLLSFTNLGRQAGDGGLIQAVNLYFKTNQTAATDFFWCNGDNLTSTTLTDNAAVAVNAGNFAACRAIHITDCTSMGASGPSVCSADYLAMPYSLASGTTGYGFVVTRGTPTLASTSDLTVTARFIRNN